MTVGPAEWGVRYLSARRPSRSFIMLTPMNLVEVSASLPWSAGRWHTYLAPFRHLGEYRWACTPPEAPLSRVIEDVL